MRFRAINRFHPPVFKQIKPQEKARRKTPSRLRLKIRESATSFSTKTGDAMSSYQRVALFVFFDSIEQDLSEHIRRMPITDHGILLTLEEARKATAVLERRSSIDEDLSDPYYLLSGLDLGEKFSVLMRNRKFLDLSAAKYFASIQEAIERSIPTRNAVMHGRPLTTIEFMNGFALADDFIRVPRYWPNLSKIYKKYAENPEAFIAQSVTLLDDSPSGEVLNNLPIPDYDDTGFLPRPDLEKELKKKILGRHPVITVLGEGGNGKTALTLYPSHLKSWR
ncbi:MAG: hypothetical protein PHW63_07075 [Alphaproteobacteria bacterium]|nr:hypothetical protein [Alphaproteobacteria bacterium]